jgi:TolA-binding protein
MRKTLLLAVVIGLCVGVGVSIFAEDTKAQSSDVAQLEEKVKTLEKKIAALEDLILPMKEELRKWQRKSARREHFTRRWEIDEKRYSKEELSKIEKLYQAAGKNLGSDWARDSLLKVVEKYPESNRAGCAILYLAQQSEGKDQEKWLKTAIQKHDNCFYGDGVQVGAYARFLLAHYYQEKGDTKQAKKLRHEIRDKYPDAVNHGGKPLVDTKPLSK